jgi:uncharacterized protein YqeY
MLLEKLQSDMKEAMKARDEIRLGTIRLLLAAVKNEEIDKRGKLEDSEIVALVKKGIKTRKEAIELYEKGNRQDLAEKEKKEMEILEKYLPKQMTEDEMMKLVEDTIATLGAVSKKDSGKVIKEIMGAHRDRVDGSTISRLVSAKLP